MQPCPGPRRCSGESRCNGTTDEISRSSRPAPEILPRRSVGPRTAFSRGGFREGAARLPFQPGRLVGIIPLMHNGFTGELKRLGPQRSYAPVSLGLAQAYCSRLARSHYENFSVASLLLPRRLLRHFHSIYAYCRWADDLGDETG